MTDLFGIDNYRKALIEQAADYIWIARDQALMLRGMYVTVFVPKDENSVDEYSDFIDDDTDYYQIQTYIEPQFEKYVMTLSLLGQDMERDYPLEVSIMSKVHLPRNSIIQIPEINSAGQPITREWRVLSTSIKQVGKIYTRTANCTPARTYEDLTTDIVEESCTGNLEVLDFTITPGDETWDLPIEVMSTGNLSVVDFIFYEPYGLVECTNKHKFIIFQPTISD